MNSQTLCPWLGLGPAALALICATGCVNNAVVFTTATRTGIEINAVDGGRQSTHVGYERFEGVTMPMVFPDGTNKFTLPQAYPVYSRFDYRTGGLLAGFTTNVEQGVILRQVFATGRAATQTNVQNAVKQEYRAISTFDTDAMNRMADISDLHAAGSPATRQAIEQAVKELAPTTWPDFVRQAEPADWSRLAELLKQRGLLTR